MEFFIDSADVEAIKELGDFLPIDGVTTNPTIITKSGKDPLEVLGQISELLSDGQKLFAQVVATDYEGILAEGRRICSLRERNMFVKVPVSRTGLKAIATLKEEGLGVLATGIYSPEQAFWAAKAGADYLAPYLNRMCNYGDGVGQVVDLIETMAIYGFDAKVCAASFKNVEQVHALLVAGVPSITVAPEVIRSMVDHPGTGIAVDKFTANWQASYGRAAFEA